MFTLDGEVTDEEWALFFDEFVNPYQTTCAAVDDEIPLASFITCLTTDPKLEKLKGLTDMNQLGEFLDRKVGFTFYDYLFLRRVNLAITTCGDQGILQPVMFFN